jgi:hypothetical protein
LDGGHSEQEDIPMSNDHHQVLGSHIHALFAKDS